MHLPTPLPGSPTVHTICTIDKTLENADYFNQSCQQRLPTGSKVKSILDESHMERSAAHSIGSLGRNINCASYDEVQEAITRGTHPSRILYTNLDKSAASLRRVARLGVDVLTVDNSDELLKIKAHHPRARLLIRINASSPSAVVAVDSEFGDAIDVACDVLEEAAALRLQVIGVSFHAGSEATDSRAYVHSIHKPANLFDEAAQQDHAVSVLDKCSDFPTADLFSPALEMQTALTDFYPAHSALRMVV